MTTENLPTEIASVILSEIKIILDNSLSFGPLNICINFSSGIPDRFAIKNNKRENNWLVGVEILSTTISSMLFIFQLEKRKVNGNDLKIYGSIKIY